ncbi:MAG: non-homologous end-joining DNA ligase [Proteobacteria bacterium]|nr:non-homologous end-joining DNA ligase [Pseudomonadota bacterium]
MTLARYHAKRDFKATPEPRGRVARGKGGPLRYVIQKHAASHLHYDFRLELDGVLLSWAVPKGPSVDPADKRLAMHVEDHPLDYGDFEGTIPAGQYGGGTVMLWDRGTWTPQGDPRKGLAAGNLKFELEGDKLHGGWALVRTHGGYGGAGKDAWLLIKERDAFARPGEGRAIVDDETRSVASGRTMDAIAGAGDRVWESRLSAAANVARGAVKPVGGRGKTAPAPRAARARKSPATGAPAAAGEAKMPDLAALPGARRARLPAAMAPMLATLVKAPVAGDDWLHEIKFDGYRLLARIERGRVKLVTRNGNDWTASLPVLAAALAKLPLASGWLDGELTVVDKRGRTSFQALQNALSPERGSRAPALTYFVFDAPYVEGYDLRAVALHERKQVVHALLAAPPDGVRESLAVRAAGADLLAQACKLGLEGLVSKRADAGYHEKRSRDWVKVKCDARQEMVIGGYTDPRGSRTGIGALLLGVYEGKVLRYSGRVGTGFDQSTLGKLAAKLASLERATPAFVNPPTGYAAKGVHWVKPALVAEVSFTEWTADGTLRHPVFHGLRLDKKPTAVVRERA